MLPQVNGATDNVIDVKFLGMEATKIISRGTDVFANRQFRIQFSDGI